jgi:hypothetical protein
MNADLSNSPFTDDNQKPLSKPIDEAREASEEERLKKMMLFMETLLKEIEKDEQKNSQTKKS